MKLWLDDVRDPAEHGCIGWVWAKTADEAVAYLATGEVTKASLDHDLGFPSCMPCRTEAASLEEYQEIFRLGCRHGEKTGYSVVCWMEQNNVWPVDGVTVHSANPYGKERMLKVIRNYYYKTQGD